MPLGPSIKRYLPEIFEELEKAPVEERPLGEAGKEKPIRGWCDGHTIAVNPIPDVCDTIIHELFHRKYPHWSEKYVKARTTQLIRAMTHEEQKQLYAAYNQKKQPKRKLVVK